MVHKHMKRWLTPLPLGKYTSSLPSHSPEWLTGNKMTRNVGKNVEQMELFPYIVGGKVSRCSHLDTWMAKSSMANTHLPHDLKIPLLRIFPTETHIYIYLLKKHKNAHSSFTLWSTKNLEPIQCQQQTE